jgi:Ca-activated chloride channel family protein
MHAAAAAGRGSYTFIGDRAQVQERMTDLFGKLEQPALTNLEVRWPGNAPAELAGAPPADVYAGDPLVIAARVPVLPQGLLTLSGSSEGHPWMRQVAISAVSPQAGIGKLWARERISALEQDGGAAQNEATRRAIIGLALAHHLVSNFTSLIAVDVTPVRPAGEPYTETQVPSAAPRGSYWAEGSTGFARTATPAPLLAFVGVFALALAGVLLAPGRRPAARGASRP